MAYHPRQVELFGLTLPIYGPVRRSYLTPFPPKMVSGDYSRDDQVLSSTWVFSSVSGGLGIKHPRLPDHQDRYDFGTLDGRFRNQLTLLPQVYRADPDGPAQTISDYNERLYYTIGMNVYRYHVKDEYREHLYTLPGVATSSAVYFGKLFILTTNGLTAYDITTDTWTVYPEVSGVALVGWDSKLFYLDQQNNIYWTVDPDDPDQHFGAGVEGAWEWGGQVPLPIGYCGHLFLYHDITQEDAIAVSTRIGLWMYDFDSYKFHQTDLKYPVLKRGGPTASCGYGSDVWRGEAYSPAGQNGYKFNHNVIEAFGPNTDEGLPEQLRGDLTRFMGGHAYLYAFLATTNVGEEPEADPDDIFDEGTHQLRFSQRTTDKFFEQSQRYGAVLATTGSAWHVMYVDYAAGAGVGAGLVSDIEGTRRLWFSSGSGLYWMEAPSSLHNSLVSPFSTYQKDGFLDTFWYDAGWRELPKLALGIEVTAENITDTEYIELYIAWNDNESWEHVGRVSRNGRNSFNLGQTKGRPFLSAKLRIEMVRGDDETKTPVLRNGLFSFSRQPRKLYGWEFTVRVGDTNTHGNTGLDVYNQLQEIFNQEVAGEFVYRSTNGVEHRNRVLISSMSGAEETGVGSASQFTVSVVQVDQQPYS